MAKELRRVTVWTNEEPRQLIGTHDVNAYDEYHARKLVATQMQLKDTDWRGTNPAFIIRDEGPTPNVRKRP